jgi:hypothetical protein
MQGESDLGLLGVHTKGENKAAGGERSTHNHSRPRRKEVCQEINRPPLFLRSRAGKPRTKNGAVPRLCFECTARRRVE